MNSYHEFQLIDCETKEEINEEEIEFYTILYGRTIENKSICVKVTNFNPYFYVELPDIWLNRPDTFKQNVSNFVDFLQQKCKKFRGSNIEDGLVTHKIVKRKKLYGFNAFKDFYFLELVFNSHSAFFAYSYQIKNIQNILYLRHKQTKIRKEDLGLINKRLRMSLGLKDIPVKSNFFEIYETNIMPLLRFMHDKDQNLSGWVKIDKKHTFKLDNFSSCDICIETDYKYLISDKENHNIAKLRILSFDIECTSCDGKFPQPSRETDKIIQIGLTSNYYGESECYDKRIIVLGSCKDLEGIKIITCKNEDELLYQFKKQIIELDPDILTGYNIFSFDNTYIHGRIYGCETYKHKTTGKMITKYFGIENSKLNDNIEHYELIYKYNGMKNYLLKEETIKLGRLLNEDSKFIEKELTSGALGQNFLYYYNMNGRIQIDLYKLMPTLRPDLSSYKLDDIASEYIKEKINKIELKEEYLYIYTSNTENLQNDSYITIMFHNGLILDKLNDKKYKVIKKKKDYIKIQLNDLNIFTELEMLFKNNNYKIYWTMVKDDLSPKDMFKYFSLDDGGIGRSIIAKYCVKDCELVNILLSKLEIVTNLIGMSNVCSVPINFLILRGQSAKTFSLVSKRCRERGVLIKVVKKLDDTVDDGYEGATVLDPICKVHFSPITVLDYASLYPSSMKQNNISHECFVNDMDYYGLNDYNYIEIIYYEGKNKDIPIKCYFARPKNDNKYLGIIPSIVSDLIDERKNVKKLMKTEKDVFKYKILDGKQLALKITGNSVYGQCGAKTSPIYFKEIAACTTATGREQLHLAKRLCESEEFAQLVYEAKQKGEIKYNFNKPTTTVYGDTDSVFLDFNLKDDDGHLPNNEFAVKDSITIGKIAEKYINQHLKWPQDIEYEKTFWPLILASKKRYVGNKYENDINSYVQTNMGVALKRRDFCPMTKIVVGGIVDCILNKKNANLAIDYMNNVISDILNDKFDLDKFIITKSLRDDYKNPERIGHKVLAERIGERDPGNEPRSGERMGFIYIKTDRNHRKKTLQGDKIENPLYIKENNLQIDYIYYLVHQIKNPTIQILNLMIDNAENEFDKFIKGYKKVHINNLMDNEIKIKTKEKKKKKHKTEIKGNGIMDLLI